MTLVVCWEKNYLQIQWSYLLTNTIPNCVKDEQVTSVGLVEQRFFLLSFLLGAWAETLNFTTKQIGYDMTSYHLSIRELTGS